MEGLELRVLDREAVGRAVRRRAPAVVLEEDVEQEGVLGAVPTEAPAPRVGHPLAVDVPVDARGHVMAEASDLEEVRD
eukprot:2894498-Alexandrium_andersonii.AAC.1